MKLSVSGLAVAAAIVWGVSALLVGLANLAWPTYGTTFLELCSSIYPGYKMTQSIGGVIVLMLYALLDGAIGGAVLGWVYNRFVA